MSSSLAVSSTVTISTDTSHSVPSSGMFPSVKQTEATRVSSLPSNDKGEEKDTKASAGARNSAIGDKIITIQTHTVFICKKIIV